MTLRKVHPRLECSKRRGIFYLLDPARTRATCRRCSGFCGAFGRSCVRLLALSSLLGSWWSERCRKGGMGPGNTNARTASEGRGGRLRFREGRRDEGLRASRRCSRLRFSRSGPLRLQHEEYARNSAPRSARCDCSGGAVCPPAQQPSSVATAAATFPTAKKRDMHSRRRRLNFISTQLPGLAKQMQARRLPMHTSLKRPCKRSFQK